MKKPRGFFLFSREKKANRPEIRFKIYGLLGNPEGLNVALNFLGAPLGSTLAYEKSDNLMIKL
jgi:hypothetical protein